MSTRVACLGILFGFGCGGAEDPARAPVAAALPDGSRVLGGGRFLYLLLDMHAPPWRIAKLRFRVQD